MSKVRRSDISPELRPAAALLDLKYHARSEAGFRRRCRRSARRKGMWFSSILTAQQTEIPRPDGTMLRVMILSSRRGTQPGAAGFLWLHSGGYAYGSPEEEKTYAEWFGGDGSCVMVLPDYRRSPEAPYPAAFDDCYQALLWMKDNAEELGISADKLFVGGAGAGGGLTAALCIAARDRGDVNIAFQMPLYPMMDDRMETESARKNNAPVWNSKKNRVAWKLYLKDLNGDRDTDGSEQEAEIPSYAAPGREKDLTGLPPACSLVGDLDPLRDETMRYFAKLKKSGVRVSLRIFSGCYHAFEINAVGSRAASGARRFLMENFRFALDNCRAQNGESSADWQTEEWT